MSTCELFCSTKQATSTVEKEMVLFEDKFYHNFIKDEELICNDEYIDIPEVKNRSEANKILITTIRMNFVENKNDLYCIDKQASSMNLFLKKMDSIRSINSSSLYVVNKKLTTRLRSMRQFLLDNSF